MNFNTWNKSLRAIRLRNIRPWILDQRDRHGGWWRLLRDSRTWGAFSIYSHCRRSDEKPKITFRNKAKAEKAAEKMGLQYSATFTPYRCLFCDGWHVSKVGEKGTVSQNTEQEVNDILSQIPIINTQENVVLDVEKALSTDIPDIMPTYGGLRGRTLSSRRQLHGWKTLIEAGVRQVIDLRADYTSTFYQELCEKCHIGYFHYPVIKGLKDIQETVELFPKFCELIDRGNFYIACAQGLHRTDIALCLYWVFHAADKGIDPPELNGYLRVKGMKPDNILRSLNEYYRYKTEKDGVPPLSPDVFKERKDTIKKQHLKGWHNDKQQNSQEYVNK